MTPHRRRWISICILLIGLGLIVSGKLLGRTFTLLADKTPDARDLCSTVFGVGCDAALLSPTSWQLGIPLAGWGIVFYGTLACLMLLARALRETMMAEATLAALLVAGAGAAGSLTLVGIVIAGRAPLCPLCLVIHVINLVLVVAFWRLTGRTTRELTSSVRAAIGYVVGGKTESPVAARWKVLGLVTTALVAIVLYQWVLVQSERRPATAERAPDSDQLLAEFYETPKQNVMIDDNDAQLGPPDASVTLVVFSDFQCPWCQSFADELYHLIDHFPDRLAVAFKHYPLGTACNPDVTRDTHPRACAAALAAEAARQQGEFWSFHDRLFASDLDATENVLFGIANELGLDLDRFEADRTAQTARAKVKADIEEGTRLGVDGTPTVFLNGRRAKRISLPVLELLIAKELESRP